MTDWADMKKEKEPPFASDGWYWIAVSNDLYQQMRDWSPAVQMRIVGEAQDVLAIEIREVDS